MLKNKVLYGILILFVGFAMSFDMANAQVTGEEEVQSQTSFTGKVVDASSGEALANATVKIKGQDMETTTDQEGKFSFENINLEAQSGEYDEGGMGNVGITFEINLEGYEPFSETLRPEDIQRPQNMGDAQDQMENIRTFALQPKVSS